MASFFNDRYAPDPEISPEEISTNPMMRRILEQMTPVQRQTRRAARLRAQNKAFNEERMKDIDIGHVQEGDTSGGLFPIAHQYIPNYGGMVEKAAAGLGEYLTGRQADRAEENLDTARSRAGLEWVQRASQPDVPPGQVASTPQSTQTQPAEAPPEEQPDNQAYNQMSQILGLPQDQADQLGAYNEANVSPNFDLSNKQPTYDRMTPIVNMEGMTPQQNQQLATAQSFMMAAGIPEEEQAGYLASMAANKSGDLPQGQTAGSLDQLQGTTTTPLSDTGTDQPNAPGMPTPLMDPNAPQQAMGATETAPTPDAAAISAPPSLPGSATPAAPAAPTPDATAAAPQGAGPGGPQDAMNQAPTDATYRAALQMIGLDPKDVMGDISKVHWVNSYVDTSGQRVDVMSDNSHVPSGEYPQGKVIEVSVEGQPHGYRFVSGPYQGKFAATDFSGAWHPVEDPRQSGLGVFGTGGATGGASAPTTGGATGAPATGGSTAPATGGSEINQRIPTKAEEAEAKGRVEEKQKAQDTLGKMHSVMSSAREAVRRVISNPALPNVLAGNLGSFVPGDEGPISHAVNAGYAMYDKAGADALADLHQLAGGAFVQGFSAIVGQGAGSVSDTEGGNFTRALTNITTAQSPERMATAVKEFYKTMDDIEARLRATAAGRNPDRPENRTYSDDDIDAAVREFGGG